jgi:anti-sigma factor RsiW
MNCAGITNDALLDFADRRLSPTDREGLAGHLDACDSCRRRLAEIETMAAALWRACEAPPPALLRQLDAALLEPPARTAAPARRSAWRPVLVGVFAGALLMGLLLLPHLQGPAPESPATTAPTALAPVPPAPTTPTPAVAPPPATAAAPAPAPRGDLNGDGLVDIADARAIQILVLRGAAPPPEADVNGDGAVDIADVYAITRSEVGGR